MPLHPHRAFYPLLVVLCGVIGCIGRPTATPTARRVTPEEQLVREFMELKNQNDPRAHDLLGPAPVVPPTAVTEEEGQRLDTEIFLRRDYQIREVRPEEKPGQFVLVLEGHLRSQPMRVGTDALATRQIYNPDLIVEVRDGKVHGVLARLHQEPNRRPLTPEEAEQIRRFFSGQ